jgi:hypothetical protein
MLMSDYDSPWGEMLEGYFPDFMAFFFPEAFGDIAWARSYESLDKELQQIVRDVALGARLADKLMKVWRRNGEEQIVLIHTWRSRGTGMRISRSACRSPNVFGRCTPLGSASMRPD